VSVGFTVAKNDVDAQAANIALQLRRALDAAHAWKAWLDDAIHNDAFLTALGYDAPSITLLRASGADLDKLYQVAHALATQGATNDFFFNAKNLLGTAL
jgi:hypothetical protein